MYMYILFVSNLIFFKNVLLVNSEVAIKKARFKTQEMAYALQECMTSTSSSMMVTSLAPPSGSTSLQTAVWHVMSLFTPSKTGVCR